MDEVSCLSVPDEWKLNELVKDKDILAEVEVSLRMVDDWADHKDHRRNGCLGSILHPRREPLL